MIELARKILSRTYFGNRAQAGRVATVAEIKAQESLFHDPEALRASQLSCLRELLQHAGEHVPYYRDLFRDLRFDPESVDSIDALKHLPILDKERIRAEGRRMVSEAVTPNSLISNASGGSTGAPLQFYQDARYLRASRVSAPLFDMWTGWSRGDPVALLWGAPTDIARYGMMRERLRNFLQNRFLMDAFDISDQKMEQAVRRLIRRRPVLVIAYASAAYLLARYMFHRNIRLDHPPRAVICSAEVLLPHYRRLIETQFDCKVFNRYGSREVGLIAMECQHACMHINSPDVIVDVQRSNGSSVGELLVTQLNNHAFPFIKYRIGDLGSIAVERCECGRHLPILHDLRGRTTDFILTTDGRHIHGEWFTHLFYDVAGVALFTFRQIAKQDYIFEIQRDDGFNPQAFSQAVEKARSKLGSASSIGVKFVKSFAMSSSGKHRFVINEHAESISDDEQAAVAGQPGR